MDSNSSDPIIHIWIPDCEAVRGGIQIFSRFFIRAVGQCLPSAQLFVFSKNDGSPPSLKVLQVKKVTCAGLWPESLRTAFFASQIFTSAMWQCPNLILSTHVNFSPVAAALKGLRRIPYATVAHGIDVWGIQNQRLGQSLRQADRVLAVSRFTRDQVLKTFGLAPEQVPVLPNTFDPEQFKPAPRPEHLLERFKLRPDQRIIFTVARMAREDRYKGYDQVLRALPAIRQAVPDVHYILGGRGSDQPRIEALIRELKLEGVVTLTSYIPDAELSDFYNLCDVFAMPGKREGFGIVYLEAMACGKPVLAGNKDGAADPLLDGELGVLVDPDDISEIEKALIAILLKKHPLPILQQPEQLRRRVCETYGYPKFVENLSKQLAQLGFQR